MFDFILSFLFPDICASCGVLGHALCLKCVDRFPFKHHTQKLDGLLVHSSLAYEEAGVLSQLIYSLKYQHQAHLAKTLASFMSHSYKMFDSFVKPILVPVPLHRSRLKERGYNQSLELASWISKSCGLSHYEMIKRVRATKPQAHLEHRKDRLENIQGAFQVDSSCQPKQNSPPIVLIDDIVTTGFTLIACRDALLSAGFKDIRALTLAYRPLKT